MGQPQTVLGFFDNVAEAQQAVQLLLARGFTRETVDLSTRTDPNTASDGGSAASAEADSSSGRFLSSLFGGRDAGQPWAGPGRPAADVDQRIGALVTVRIQSAHEASQVAELLDTAGAGDVAVDERTAPNGGQATGR